MHNTTAYPLPRQLIAATPQQASALTYLRAATLSVWMFSLLLRYWWISDWFALQEQLQEGVDLKGYYYIGFAVVVAAHFTLGVQSLAAAPFAVLSTWSGRMFTAFCVFELLVSPLSLAPRASALYALATWSVLALLVLYWQSDYRAVQRMVVLTGFIVLGWIIILLIKHGLIFGLGSAIGGINRNTTTFAAIGGAVCCQLSPSKVIRWATLAAAVFLSAIVTSRGGIVALGAFITVYFAISHGLAKSVLYAALALAVVGAVFLASHEARDFIFEDIMHLHDAGRGIGSGFTGRVAHWNQAIVAFWRRPVIGYGFRLPSFAGSTDIGGIHSGYLKLLVETGLVGTILVVGAVLIEGCRRLLLAVRFRDISQQSTPGIDVASTYRINAVACATIAMTLVIWVYEQLYINLGSVVSVVFFMMIVAPAYITTQGVTLRR